jgi:uncharacterized damage-inducible protein DinB
MVAQPPTDSCSHPHTARSARQKQMVCTAPPKPPATPSTACNRRSAAVGLEANFSCLDSAAVSPVTARGPAPEPGVCLAGSFYWPPRVRDDRLVAVTEQSTGDAVPGRWNAVGPKSNMWMDPAQDPRFAAGAELDGERATLLDYLRAYRLALELKCADLDAEQLAQRSVPPSTMSLLGLVRHMADVERNWFRRVMAQADAPPLYWSDDAEDADWAGAVADPAVVAGAWRAWREEVAFAEQFVADTPDLAIRSPMQNGTTVALREVILHMVEEYARHLGHADLLRERIDGRVGQ